MSVDLEDYYCDLPFSQWNQYTERIIENTKTILQLFEKYNITATFFTLGYIAEKHPELIEDIVSKGHEIASHSYSHIDLRKVDMSSFEKDLVKSLNVLRSASKEKILGFRAPFFSIDKSNLSVFKILKKYLHYDSSIFPVKTPLYGISSALRECYRVSDENPLKIDEQSNFFEIPMTTLRIPVLGNIPMAGGFYLRFFPVSLIKYSIQKMNKNGAPCMCYIHPKDIDPKMPRISQYTWHYYWGLKDAEKKFESLLKNFRFSSARNVLNC